ncbi:hypothetical protein B5181_33875, partial [Streptomyces sp. 4F]
MDVVVFRLRPPAVPADALALEAPAVVFSAAFLAGLVAEALFLAGRRAAVLLAAVLFLAAVFSAVGLFFAALF